MCLLAQLTKVLATYMGSAFAYSSVISKLDLFSPTKGPWHLRKLCTHVTIASEQIPLALADMLALASLEPPNRQLLV
jgi:hypothetical protein